MNASMRRVLVVDDDEQVREMVIHSLGRLGHSCAEAATAEEARLRLGEGEFELLICDVQMPAESGLSLLRDLHSRHGDLAVVMVSGQDDPYLAEVAIEHGAYGYLIKPFSPNELQIMVSGALSRLRLKREGHRQTQELEEAVERRTAELAQMVGRLERSRHELRHSHQETIQRLSRALELRDAETEGHVERIAASVGLIAAQMGLSEEATNMIRAAAPMHDVGKIGIPDEILLKPRRLSDEERLIMQRHAEIGRDILAGSGSELLDLAAQIAFTHHERFDGSGYPRGMAGTDIPLGGRIVAVSDVFDGLTHDRVQRPAYPLERAIAMMREERGGHFDPGVLDAFFECLPQVLGLDDENAEPPPEALSTPEVMAAPAPTAASATEDAPVPAPVAQTVPAAVPAPQTSAPAFSAPETPPAPQTSAPAPDSIPPPAGAPPQTPIVGLEPAEPV